MEAETAGTEKSTAGKEKAPQVAGQKNRKVRDTDKSFFTNVQALRRTKITFLFVIIRNYGQKVNRFSALSKIDLGVQKILKVHFQKGV